jgi:tetratricopeptide (TPR) repeat protein
MLKNLFLQFLILVVITSIEIRSEEIRLLIDPFEFESIQLKQYSYIAVDMSDNITNALSALPKIKFFSSEDRKKILKEIGLLQQMGTAPEEDEYISLKKPNLLLSGRLILQDNQLKTSVRITKVKNMSAKVIVINEKFSLQTLDSYYNRLLLEIIKNLETLNDDTIQNLVLSEEFKSEFKIKKLFNPKAVEYYYSGKTCISDDYLKAKEYFLKAIQLEPEYADAYTALGSIYSLYTKEYDRAKIEFEKALDIYKNLKDNESYRYIELLTLIAGNHYSQGNYSDSLEKYYQSKVGLESLSMNDSLSMAYIDYGIGICYSGMNQRHKATSSFKSAKTIFDSLKLQKSLGYANVLYGLAYVQLGLNEYDSSLENYKQAHKIYANSNQSESVVCANILYSIGFILEKKSDTKEAGRYYKKAFLLYEKNGYQGKEKISSKNRMDRLEN